MTTPKSRTYKKRIVWTPEMESVLIDIWKERASDLRKAKRNQHVFMEMAEEFNRNDMVVSPSEVKTKIDNFTRTYRYF